MAHTLLDFLDGARACTERAHALGSQGRSARVSWAELVTSRRDGGCAPDPGTPAWAASRHHSSYGADFFASFFGAIFAGCAGPSLPPVRLGRIDEYLKRTAVMLQVTESQLLITEPRIKRILGEPQLGQPPARLLQRPSALPWCPDRPPRDPSPRPSSIPSGTTVDPGPVALTHRAVTAQSL